MATDSATRERRALAFDAAVAVVVAVTGAVSVAVVGRDDARSVPWVAYAVIVATGLPLVVRRRWPTATWAVVALGTAVYGLNDWPDPPLYLGGMIAVFTAAALAPRRTAITVGAVTFAAAGLAWAVDDASTDANDLLSPVLASSTAWLAGYASSVQRQRIDLLAERAADLERQREDELERAVADERLRIARDLHDTTAHHVSVMAVQAEAALADPAATAASLTAIAGSARLALADLRRMLGALRGGGGASRTPQPGLADLTALVEQLRSGGLVVELSATGGAPTGDGAEVAAFRIAQEAMTNAVRHAGASRIDVSVDLRTDWIAVVVADDGQGAAPGLVEGHGLRGMRERVALYDGTLELAAREPTGLVVSARLRR